MYLFSRFRAHNGHYATAARDAFVNVANVATRVTGMPVFAWQVSYHPQGNGYMTSARVDSQAQLESAWDKMMADESMAKAMEGVAQVVPSPPIDNLARVVGGSLGEGPPAYARVTTAQAASGRVADAAAWGIQMAEASSASLGVPVVCTVNVAGVYGGIALLASYKSADQMDEVSDKLMTDSSLQKMIADAADLFEGEGAQILLRRLN